MIHLKLGRKVLKSPKRKYDKDTGCYDIDYDSDYDVDDHKLETLCDYYSIFRDNAHRASSDCLATGLLFEILAKEIIE